jgi:hypothetical protein
MPNSLGSTTRLVFTEAPEPGKLHVEFEAGTALRKGQQVKLNSTGQIIALAAGESNYQSIGVLIQNVDAEARATVATKGYAMVIALSDAAIDPGPVEIGTYDTVNDRPVYDTITGVDDTAKTVRTVGYNIDDLAGAGEIRVILI